MKTKHIKLYENWFTDLGNSIVNLFTGGGDDEPKEKTAAPSGSTPAAGTTASNTAEFIQQTEQATTDISDLSIAYRGWKMKDPRKYFIVHHTAGRGDAEDVVRILNTRRNKKTGKLLKLAVQFVVDREGRIFRTFPDGLVAGHAGVKEGYRKAGSPTDQSNSNSQGVEVIAEDDSDVLPVQAEAVRRIIRYLGISPQNIYGHGEITTNKEEDEGRTIKNWVLKYWNEPFFSPDETIARLGGVTDFNDPRVMDYVANMQGKESNLAQQQTSTDQTQTPA